MIMKYYFPLLYYTIIGIPNFSSTIVVVIIEFFPTTTFDTDNIDKIVIVVVVSVVCELFNFFFYGVVSF